MDYTIWWNQKRIDGSPSRLKFDYYLLVAVFQPTYYFPPKPTFTYLRVTSPTWVG